MQEERGIMACVDRVIAERGRSAVGSPLLALTDVTDAIVPVPRAPLAATDIGQVTRHAIFRSILDRSGDLPPPRCGANAEPVPEPDLSWLSCFVFLRAPRLVVS